MNDDSREETLKVRPAAAESVSSRSNTQDFAKGDEQMFRQYVIEKSEKDNNIHPTHLATYTEGMPHDDDNGMVWNPTDAQNLINAINSGDQRDIK